MRILIDKTRHEVYVDGKRTPRIPPTEYKILVQLAEAKGMVVDRRQILDLIWGIGNGGRVDTRTVDQHIARLRNNLGAGRACIVTRTGFGYKAENVDFMHSAPIYGQVTEIERFFDPKPGARVTLDVSGDVLQELKKGQKILVA